MTFTSLAILSAFLVARFVPAAQAAETCSQMGTVVSRSVLLTASPS
jgi:hypothetical protein